MAAWLILTDLDGSLLDSRTYTFSPAAQALAHIRRAKIPLGLVSSKTRREIARIRKSLDVEGPSIAENGAVVKLPDQTIHQFGVPKGELGPALRKIGSELGFEPVSFDDLGVEGIMARTGLDAETARLALARDGNLPFVPPREIPADEIRAAARRLGFKVVRGGRFLHLIGHDGKGEACQFLLDWYRSTGVDPKVIAIGDAPADISFLELGDLRVCIPTLDHGPDPDILEAFPDIEVATSPGPAGWNEAMLRILATADIGGA